MTGVERGTILVDGLTTTYLEAGVGNGDPLVLLHGGEFGASAELGWERTIEALAMRHHVLAPDQIGYGGTAKVIDFNEGRRMRIRHVARFCELLGITSAGFVGNSMGGLNMLVDATSEDPLLPVNRMVAICGGGEILANPQSAALFDYDTTFESMRLVVAALFHDPSFAADDGYVRRRHESSLVPGAWEAIAAARFRRPGAAKPATPRWDLPYERIGVPTLVLEGGADKLKPAGWAAEIAERLVDGTSLVVEDAGHCPQIERPELVNDLLVDFFARAPAAGASSAGAG